MTSRRFSGDPTEDAIACLACELAQERARLRRVIGASLTIGVLRRADLAKLGAVLVEIAALREVEREVLPELRGETTAEAP